MGKCIVNLLTDCSTGRVSFMVYYKDSKTIWGSDYYDSLDELFIRAKYKKLNFIRIIGG